MKTTFKNPIKYLTIILLTVFSNILFAQPCSDAGNSSATEDTICNGASTTLLLNSYIGAIQWQSFDGSIWMNETGIGSTTDNYNVSPTLSTDYRAVVTDVGCDPDTSAIVNIVVDVTAPTGTGASRCGYGQVILSAIGPGIKWYDVSTGGIPVNTGPTLTTNVATTTTFYAASSLGGGPPSPFTTTFAAGNGFDGNMFDITALNTVTIDSFAANFNSGPGTAEIWYRPGTHVGFTNSNVGWTQAGTASYTSTGNGAPGTPINIHVNVSIPAGQTYAFYVHGTGGISYTNGTNVGNIFAQDSNIEFKEGFGGAYFNLTNSPRVFNGRIMYSAGCESPRTPVTATVNTATPFTISATSNALCLGDSSTITLTSNNLNYNYSWSPATGLSSTTGTSVVANPTSPVTYTIVADDGTCGFIDSIFIDVGPTSVAGTAFTYQDTICFGNSTDLILQGSVGAVQWQRFDGTNWIDETGISSDSIVYNITPLVDGTYRAIITSGGCPSDTSSSIDIVVLTITDPILSDTSLCGSGNVTITPVGQGNFNWYDDSTSVTPFYTGQSYMYNATSTDTFWVESFGGADYTIGAVNPGIGNQTNGTSNDLGMAFDVIAGCTIESVKIFPQAAGPVTINLRDTQGGPVLASYSTNVIAFLGQDIPIKFTVSPGTNYRLELAAGSVACTRNTTGASYPYQVLNGPLEITGYYTPNFGSGGAYYWFYDWRVSEGCKSARKPVIVTVNPFPPTPTIGQTGNTLVSSAPNGNQWILNGSIIPGANGQSHFPTAIGTYTVAVTVNGCTSLSPPFTVTTIGINEIDGITFNTFPNPVHSLLTIQTDKPVTFYGSIHILDMQGREIAKAVKINKGESVNLQFNVNDLSSGFYFIEIRSNEGNSRIKFQKL